MSLPAAKRPLQAFKGPVTTSEKRGPASGRIEPASKRPVSEGSEPAPERPRPASEGPLGEGGTDVRTAGHWTGRSDSPCILQD